MKEIRNEYLEYFKKLSGASDVKVVEQPTHDYLNSKVRVTFDFDLDGKNSVARLFEALEKSAAAVKDIADFVPATLALRTLRDYLRK